MTDGQKIAVMEGRIARLERAVYILADNLGWCWSGKSEKIDRDDLDKIEEEMWSRCMETGQVKEGELCDQEVQP